MRDGDSAIPDSAPLASEIRRRIKSEGHRMTRPWSLILAALRQAGGHLTVEEISERVRRSDPGVSLPTVYRTISLVKEMSLVRECHLDEEHHHYELADAADHCHLICSRCGKVNELAVPELQGYVGPRRLVGSRRSRSWLRSAACASRAGRGWSKAGGDSGMPLNRPLARHRGEG